MININRCESGKYDNSYVSRDDGVYEKDGLFYLSLSFLQEPQLGEGNSPKEISQYPLEDILDRYGVWVSDFYRKLNRESKDTCYLEFASEDFQSIQCLQEIVGKHVYNKTVNDNGKTAQILVVEELKEEEK